MAIIYAGVCEGGTLSVVPLRISVIRLKSSSLTYSRHIRQCNDIKVILSSPELLTVASATVKSNGQTIVQMFIVRFHKTSRILHFMNLEEVTKSKQMPNYLSS